MKYIVVTTCPITLGVWYVSDLPVPPGDYGYHSKAEKALHMTERQMKVCVKYMNSVGRKAISIEVQLNFKQIPFIC